MPWQRPSSQPNRGNPYKRAFGTLSTADLEKQIATTERELAGCQGKFSDAAVLRDSRRSKELHEQFDVLTRKLEDLESEYFLREK